MKSTIPRAAGCMAVVLLLALSGCSERQVEPESGASADGMSAAERTLAELEQAKEAKRKEAEEVQPPAVAEATQQPAAPEAPAQVEAAQPTAEEQAAAELSAAERAVNAKDAEMREQLEAIGYIGVADRDVAETGVTKHVQDKAFPGLTLYASGHGPEAFLIDLDGKEVHTWRFEFNRAWPNYQSERMIREQSRTHFRRVHMYPNGDLLAIFENIGMIKIDKDSNLLWAYQGRCHHDMDVTEDGAIFVLANDLTWSKRGGKDVWTLEPMVAVLDSEGKEVQKYAILEFIRNSNYYPLLDKMQKTGDILHFNTVEVFDGSMAGRSPLYKKGNILVSSRKLSFIAILDPEVRKVTWALTGMWQGQHEPTLLPNGNMLIFDNARSVGRSRVMEFEPFTQQVVWLYNGTDQDPLWSGACGTQQRLPNGNTLIAETQGARAIEVTPEGKIVWEFLNPHMVMAGKKLRPAVIHMAFRLLETPEWLAQESSPH